MIYCLEHLGPWCAAAAAYLDLLAPPTTAEEEAAAEEQAAMEAAGNVWQGAEDEDRKWLAWLRVHACMLSLLVLVCVVMPGCGTWA